MYRNGEWEINGVAFSDVKNRILARPTRGLTEVWELENKSGGWSHRKLHDYPVLKSPVNLGDVNCVFFSNSHPFD